MQTTQPLSSLEKSLDINLDASRYGTFAEIGAGQEVVRWFFQAGGAAGTISKSISAYDMQVSDAIYGDCERYVCRGRLEAMLEYEQNLTRSRLASARGSDTAFFTFADTVSARNFAGNNECHAWMGIRFQSAPGDDDSTIIVHARMLDPDNRAQQQALGIVGVNLIHGAFNLHQQPETLIAALLDGLSVNRIEIDMIDFSGPAFDAVDNRIMSLHLVQLGLTGAAMFSADGQVLQPSEILRKRPLVVERGRFRPVTHVNIDMLNATVKQFQEEHPGDDPLPLMEVSMHNLYDDGEICMEDFISRADVLASTGHTVMISDFPEFYRLAAYLSRYTTKAIGMAIGVNTLSRLFAEQHYEHLDGGILESLGRLFKHQIQLFVYPCKQNAQMVGLDGVQIGSDLQHLLEHLRARRCIVPLHDVTEHLLDIHSPEVLRMIGNGDSGWTDCVPAGVARKIKEGRLFGYAG